MVHPAKNGQHLAEYHRLFKIVKTVLHGEVKTSCGTAFLVETFVRVSYSRLNSQNI